MNKTLIGSLAAISLVAAGTFTFASSAEAAALKLSSGSTTKTVYDNGVGDLDSDAGVVNRIGAVGVFTTNITGGVTKPKVGSATNPYLDLFNLSLSSRKAGTLNVQFTETGFTSGGSIINLLTSVGGTTSGNVTFNVYADSGNTAFNTSNKLGTFTSAQLAQGGTAFAGSNTFAFLDSSSATPYSITLESVITHGARGGQTSFDYELKKASVPEPGTLMGLGVVSAALVTSRRQKAVKS